jgi:hypothetical protein
MNMSGNMREDVQEYIQIEIFPKSWENCTVHLQQRPIYFEELMSFFAFGKCINIVASPGNSSEAENVWLGAF